jgi:hypothetical protein
MDLNHTVVDINSSNDTDDITYTSNDKYYYVNDKAINSCKQVDRDERTENHLLCTSIVDERSYAGYVCSTLHNAQNYTEEYNNNSRSEHYYYNDYENTHDNIDTTTDNAPLLNVNPTNTIKDAVKYMFGYFNNKHEDYNEEKSSYMV